MRLGPILVSSPQLRAGGKNIGPVVINNKQYCHIRSNTQILVRLAGPIFGYCSWFKINKCDNIKLIVNYYRAYICHQPKVVGRWQNIGPRRSWGPIFVTCPQLRAGGKNICPVIINNKRYCQLPNPKLLLQQLQVCGRHYNCQLSTTTLYYSPCAVFALTNRKKSITRPP